MPVSAGFLDFVRDLLSEAGEIEIRRMFGAAGLMSGGAMFAVVDDDVLYLKADDEFAEELQAMGSTRWSYSHRSAGSKRLSHHWSLPESAADDAELASRLALRSIAIATAKKARKSRKA